MATFVIVHGGWGGGWEWTSVARKLRQHGHEVFTPTLTGLGERAHLGSGIGLSDHIEDVLAVLAFEELSDVVLCGQSYGGMVVTGVADRRPDAVRLLVYLDAFVPRDGQALADLAPAELIGPLVETAASRGDGRAPLPPALVMPEGLISEPRRASYLGRLQPHPIATMTEPLELSGDVEALPRAYVRCTGKDEVDPFAVFAARARNEGWLYREIDTPHDLQLFDPDGTAALLHELATAQA
ncbi:MAG: alpha/beta hydrolase [Gammaproteobacteria bacterium]|nr:alpha/beta hydrolase [Gammaproteobacteria bacterium]